MWKKLLILTSLVLLSGCSVVNTDPTPKPEPEPEVPTVEVTRFILRGVSYELPVSYKTLQENGWEANTEINYEIASNTFINNVFLRNDDNIIKVTFFNETDQTKMMEDVLIAEIEAENRTFGGDVAVDITVHNGLNFNSTFDDIKSQLGEPTEAKDAVFADYTYTQSGQAKTIFRYYLDGRDGEAVRWIIISNFNH